MDKNALDRHITGNYGEDQFIENEKNHSDTCDECGLELPVDHRDDIYGFLCYDCCMKESDVWEKSPR